MSHRLFRLKGKGLKVPPITDPLLLESATSLAKKIRTGKLSSVELLKTFIARIQKTNPFTNAVIADRYDAALQEAAEADKLIKSNKMTEEMLAANKPFIGIPFTTKDCIELKGLNHTAGMYARKDIKAEKDADVVQLLKKAGAIPLALTNVPEMCMWWETNNTIFGRSNNPYDTKRIAGGSSGGEGSLQASAGSAFGIGSDIGGSIRIPSFYNGIFGHKPSKNMVSIIGHYPPDMDVNQKNFLGIGPMCRHAEDLSPILKVITAEKSAQLRLDEPVQLGKVRFFYQKTDMGHPNVTPVFPEILQAFDNIARYLEGNGIKAKEIKHKQFAKTHDMWMFNIQSPTHTYEQMLAYPNKSLNKTMELLKMPFGGSKHTFVAVVGTLLQRLHPYGTEKYHKFKKELEEFRKEITEMLGSDGVLLYPTLPMPAPYHNEPLFKSIDFHYTAIVNALHLPATNIPLGLNEDGLPIGIQVVANDKCDRLCLAVARDLEKAFGGWVPPSS